MLSALAAGLRMPAEVPSVSAAATPAAAGSITGTVHGVDGTGQTFPVLIAAASQPQPVDLGPFGPVERASVQTRSGVGLIMPGASGAFAAAGLTPGDYIVVLIAPGSAMQSPSRSTTPVTVNGNVLTLPSESVRLEGGASARVAFAAAAPVVGPATLHVSARTYDEKRQSSPDAIVKIELSPSVAAAETQLLDAGDASVANVPAGTYMITILTKRGFSLSKSIDVNGGENAELNLILSPAETGGITLPQTGREGNVLWPRRENLVVALAILAVFCLAAGAVAILAARAAHQRRGREG